MQPSNAYQLIPEWHMLPSGGTHTLSSIFRVYCTGAERRGATKLMQHLTVPVLCVQEAEPSSAAKRAQQPQGQRSKWGFVPGEDDTLDLNLEKAGGQ